MPQVNLKTQHKRKVQRVAGHSTSQPAGGAIWQWQNEVGGFTPYAPHLITAIEKAYSNKKSKFQIPQSPFRILFSEMIQVGRVRIVYWRWYVRS